MQNNVNVGLVVSNVIIGHILFSEYNTQNTCHIPDSTKKLFTVVAALIFKY